MAHGGARPGSGRPKGMRDKFAKVAAEKAAAEGLMPLDYMLAVMRDQTADEAKRLDAAKAAAPYVHARLNATTLSGDLAVTHEDALAGLR